LKKSIRKINKLSVELSRGFRESEFGLLEELMFLTILFSFFFCLEDYRESVEKPEVEEKLKILLLILANAVFIF